MADSLVLTGKKTVTKHTGTEMVRLDDKRGGNTWQLPRWWVTGGNGTVYVASTVFKVTAGGDTGYLAIASTSESTRVKILHDGSFNFDFQYMNEVSRGALFDADMKVVEHYVFPKISGGKTMVVTPAGGATRPGGGSPPAPPAPTPDVEVTIDSTNGSAGYILSGDAVGENATINVTSGDLLSITNNTGSHPIYIKTALGAGNSGQINDGSVTGQGATNGAVVWDTDGVAAGTYYYQCQLHEDMNGEIVVS